MKPPRTRLRRFLRGTAVLAGVIVVLILVGLPCLGGWMFTSRRFAYQDKQNAGLTPSSFELPFEDVRFSAKDGVPLSGWWVPAAAPRGTVVLVHGLNRSRIEMIRKVPALHARGWNALLFDLRHHGTSGGSLRSFGHFERQDVVAAAALARERSPGPVVLWGVSMGAATALLAAADDKEVAGVVADSSYRSLRDTVRHHLGLLQGATWWLRPLPTWLLAPELTFWVGRFAGFDPDEVDLVAAAHRLSGRPALFVCTAGDRRMPKEIVFDLQAAAGPQAQVMVVPGERHAHAYADATTAYETAVSTVLDAAAASVRTFGDNGSAAPALSR